MTFELHNNLHNLFFLDPLKPHFYFISTGLRGSVIHADFFPYGTKKLNLWYRLLYGKSI